MFQGIKEFISVYKEPFNREVKAKRVARERLRTKGVDRPTKSQLEDEIEEVLDEWELKADWGINAHKKLQEEGLIKYPNAIINSVTVPKNMPISFQVITFFSMVASGNDKPTTAIIKAIAVPSGTPLATKTCTTGTIPEALAYIGTAKITATGTAYHLSADRY